MNTSYLTHKRVLVTGGAGFIGSNLCEQLLKDDNEIVCVDNFITGKRENIAPFLTDKRFTLIEGDIRDISICRKAVEGIDVVFQEAALGSVPRSINDPLTTTAINILGFANMLYASVEAKVKRFVYAASSSTYGDSTQLPKVEHIIGKPLSPYAITKYVNELYADNFAKLYGIQTIGLRYFNVFGRRQDPHGAYAAVIPKFVIALLQHKQPVINGDGSYSRDFTYIDNVIQANELAATTTNAEAINQVFNVACGQSTTLETLVQLLKNNLSAYDPEIARIEALHGDFRAGDIPHSLASIEKIQRLLHYNPAFDMASGLKEACKWYYENLK